jgi:hypothetical protein
MVRQAAVSTSAQVSGSARQDIPWSRALRVWRGSGASAERALIVLLLIDDAENPEDDPEFARPGS